MKRPQKSLEIKNEINIEISSISNQLNNESIKKYKIIIADDVIDIRKSVRMLLTSIYSKYNLEIEIIECVDG